MMANGYTDSTFLTAAGIPAYGVPGAWGDPNGNGAHGLNELIEVRSVYVGRDYKLITVRNAGHFETANPNSAAWRTVLRAVQRLLGSGRIDRRP